MLSIDPYLHLSPADTLDLQHSCQRRRCRELIRRGQGCNRLMATPDALLGGINKVVKYRKFLKVWAKMDHFHR